MDTHLQADDGTALWLRRWPQANARGRVVIVHGLGEHGGRYAWLAQALNTLGWAVFAHDLRGHGRSAGSRGRLRRTDDPLRDLAVVLDVARAEGGGPLLLLGHSLGGAIAARFVAEGLAPDPAAWHRPVDALVLSSPALDPGLNAAQKLLLALLGPLAPNLAVHNGLKHEWISRDADVVRAYRDDPLVHDRVSARLVRCLLDAGATVLQHAPRWRVPTLLLYAGSDRCVAPRGSAAFAAAAPAAVVTTQAFAPLYHEIFNEPERDAVFGVLRDWLSAREIG